MAAPVYTAMRHTTDPHPVSPLTPITEPASAERRYWQRARVLAAQLVAEGVPHNEIAARVKKSRAWVTESKRHPWFKARVAELVNDMAEDARRIGLANQQERLAAQNNRWAAMHQVIAERAASPEHAHVPGWQTGLLTHDIKTAKDGVYDVYEVDAGLLGEIRALESQVARELDQVPRGNVTIDARTQVMLVRQYEGIDPEELA